MTTTDKNCKFSTAAFCIGLITMFTLLLTKPVHSYETPPPCPDNPPCFVNHSSLSNMTGSVNSSTASAVACCSKPANPTAQEAAGLLGLTATGSDPSDYFEWQIYANWPACNLINVQQTTGGAGSNVTVTWSGSVNFRVDGNYTLTATISDPGQPAGCTRKQSVDPAVVKTVNVTIMPGTIINPTAPPTPLQSIEFNTNENYGIYRFNHYGTMTVQNVWNRVGSVITSECGDTASNNGTITVNITEYPSFPVSVTAYIQSAVNATFRTDSVWSSGASCQEDCAFSKIAYYQKGMELDGTWTQDAYDLNTNEKIEELTLHIEDSDTWNLDEFTNRCWKNYQEANLPSAPQKYPI